MPKCGLAEWSDILGCPYQGKSAVLGARFDSRELRKGDLFFALQGKKVDGHSFLEEVAKKGAVGAVVAKSYEGPDFGLPLFRVDDVISSLQNLAKEVQKRRKNRVIAVTGSVGKTTTKEFIATLLSKKYRVGKTPGNANSQVGLPLTLLNMEGDEEVLVLEMGMTQFKEIEKLVEIAPPEVAVVTKIGHAHIGFFGDKEQIAVAKSEIFSNPSTRLGIIGKEMLKYPSFQKLNCSIRSFSSKGQADYTLKKRKEEIFIEEDGKKSPPLIFPFSEKHLIEDFLIAAAAAREMNLEWEEMAEQVPSLTLFEKRFEKIKRGEVLFINDSYNASFESVITAIDNLPPPKGVGRRVFVFGEMVELGSYSESCHRKVAEHASSSMDVFFCYGRGCFPMIEVLEKKKKQVSFHLDFKELSKALFDVVRAGDVVLIKGAKINALWRLLD